MYNNTNNISGMNNMSQSLDHTESMLLTNGAVQQQQLGIDQQQQQLDSLSNLFINNWETEDAALEQYESEMDNTINDNLLNEKEQSNQRLFQSFQTSACAVAQMFKEKSAPSLSPNSSSNGNSTSFSWQSFQNSAGAITVLYKDSLEACKVHMDLGVCIGQQRKVKEIINWVKKKKKRTICKDELISFLIGKQYTNTSNQNQMFNLFSQNNSNANNGLVNTNLISKANSNNSLSSQQQQQATAFMAPNRRQQSMNRQQQTQLGRSNTNNSNSINNNNNSNNSNTASSSLLTNQMSSSLNPIGENSSGSNDSQAVETNSDLATFREALIMHNRSRDAPFNRSHHTNSHQNQHLNHLSHHHHHHHHHHPQQNLYHSQNSTNNTTGLSTNLIATNPSQQQQQQLTNMTSTGTTAPNCDDLDCFFCEQIATHIEHKRSAANSNNFNLDMESPTRKRGRFC